MFKVKTTIKHKKEFVRYIIRRVNNTWEMSSAFHKVIGQDLNEMALILDELSQNQEAVHTRPHPKTLAKQKKTIKKAKSSRKKSRSKK